MKKNFALLFVLPIALFYSLKGEAQNQRKIDSLKLAVMKVPSDSLQIKAYADLCWAYTNTRTKLDTARMYADTIFIQSKKINYEYGITLSSFYYGVIDRYEGNFYRGIKEMEKFIAYHEKKGDSSRIAAGLYQVGVMQNSSGEYVKALATYQRTLNIYRYQKNRPRVAQMWHSMAHLQRKIDKHEKAISSYKKAIAVWKEANNMTALSMSTESLGNTYGEIEKYDQAELFLLDAFKIVENEKRPYGIASVSENLGNLYGKMNRNAESLKYHLKALTIRERLPSKKNLAISLSKVGQVYNKIGESDLANDYLLKSLTIAKKSQLNTVLEQLYKALSENYTNSKNYLKALEYQKLYTVIKDSILDVEKSKQLLDLETKYETVQKDKEIALLNKEKEVQEAKTEQEKFLRNTLFVIVGLLSIIAGLIVFGLRNQLKNQKLLSAKNEEIRLAHHREQLKELETKALRAQMNPHFLFNSLNSINTMILNEEGENARRYLSKFSKLVRLTLENSEKPLVLLNDEIEMLKSYIELEALRFNDKIDYSIDVENGLDPASIQIPSMLLQPFVENAIWHGLMTKKGKGKVKIAIREDNDHLFCTITDNGIGREQSLRLKTEGSLSKKSMGIQITTDRLKMLSKQKIQEALRIIDLKDENNNALGTQVLLQIPIS